MRVIMVEQRVFDSVSGEQRAACPKWNKQAMETRKELLWLAAGTCTFLCRDLVGKSLYRPVDGERRCLVFTFNTILANV